MIRRSMLRKIACWTVAVLLIAVAATAVAETASRTLNITEVYMATRANRNVDEVRTTTFERNSGWIFCFIRMENPSGGGNEILVSFEPDEGEPGPAVRGIRLRVPARYRYRSVARTGSTMPAGNHRCVVRDREGAVLSHTPFQVTE